MTWFQMIYDEGQNNKIENYGHFMKLLAGKKIFASLATMKNGQKRNDRKPCRRLQWNGSSTLSTF